MRQSAGSFWSNHVVVTSFNKNNDATITLGNTRASADRPAVKRKGLIIFQTATSTSWTTSESSVVYNKIMTVYKV